MESMRAGSSPSLSPRHSDTSLNSVPTPFSACEQPPQPLPAHASTSTISRSSHASNDDPFLHPPSFTRLPKAKVFVRREPSRIVNRDRPLPPPKKPADQRCVSDIHDVYRVTQRTQPLTDVTATKNDRVRTDLHALVDQLPDAKQVPQWIPSDERRDWHAQYAFDPCEVEEDSHPSSRWATSLRNLANMYKPKPSKTPDVRGSVLQVQPPTLGERLGISSKGDKRRHASKLSQPTQQSPTCHNAPPATSRCKKRQNEPRLARSRARDTQQQQPEQMSWYADDYVGFLEKPSARLLCQRYRHSWFRFLRRGRAARRS